MRNQKGSEQSQKGYPLKGPCQVLKYNILTVWCWILREHGLVTDRQLALQGAKVGPEGTMRSKRQAD
jgi:hypothetical protein